MATMASVQGLPSATPCRVAACFPRSGFLQCTRQHRRRARHHAAATMNVQLAGAVLFELDGTVMDMHMDGHRVAFNRALASLGYEASGSACMHAGALPCRTAGGETARIPAIRQTLPASCACANADGSYSMCSVASVRNSLCLSTTTCCKLATAHQSEHWVEGASRSCMLGA